MTRTAPMNCSAHLTPVAAGATEWGYRAFNEAEHLCVDLPDHPVTITCRDSKERTTTIYFGNYAKPGEAQAPTFIDIQHMGDTRQPDRPDLPAMAVVGFGPGTGDSFDSRDLKRSPSLVAIMCDGEEAARKSGKDLPTVRTLNHRLKGAVEALEAILAAFDPTTADERAALALAQEALDKATAPHN